MKYKLIFKKIKPKQILFAEDNQCKLKFENISSYTIDNKEINLYYLLFALIKYFFGFFKISFRDVYLKIILEELKPKIVISHELTERGHRLKRLYPPSKLIMYQFGNFFPRFYSELKTRFSKKKTDYFLAWNKRTTKILEKHKTKFLIAGSVKNNLRLRTHRKKKYDIMFISEFRSLDNERTINFNPSQQKEYFLSPQSTMEYHVNDLNPKKFENVISSIMVRYLNEYCKKKNKKLCIARSSLREDKKNKISINDENLFYKIHAPNHYTENCDSETLAEMSKLIICVSSNLGPLLFSKGHKVLFLNYNYFAYEWEFKSRKLEGPFWYKGTDKDKIFKKIDQMLKVSPNKIRNESKKYFNIVKHDPENKILNKLIKNILKKEQNF